MREQGYGHDDMEKDDAPASPQLYEETASVKLGDLGPIEAPVRQDINGFSIIALAFNTLSSWAGLACTLAIGAELGGTITVLYGCFATLLLYLATGGTLAELASLYPTAGGQYHFTSILASAKYSRVLSYACGTIAALSWISLAASTTIIMAQIMLAMVVLWDDSYVPQDWHYFLIFQAMSFALLMANLFLTKKAPLIHDLGFILSVCMFVIALITCLALASPKQSNDFVWKTWIKTSSWPDGVVFFEDIATPAFMFAGLDSALHVAEECTRPSKTVPKAVMFAVVTGFCTAFPFAIALFYCISDFNAVLTTKTRLPIIEIYLQATKSRAGATVFCAFHFCISIFNVNAIQQTTSRLTWALARDNALWYSHVLGRIHPKLQVPAWALCFNYCAIFLTGCLYFSADAFNALVSIGIILQQISFAFPAILLLMNKRKQVVNANFHMPGIVGWVANILVIVAAILWTIFFEFPTSLPTTAGTMNYAVVALGIMGAIALANWFVHGRKHYQGPRIELYSEQ